MHDSNAKWIVRGVIAFVVIVILWQSFYSIDQNEVGIITQGGRVTGTEGPGYGLKIPIIQRIHTLPTYIQEVANDKPANTYTVDNQEVDVQFNVFYHIPAANAVQVFVNVPDYEQRLLIMSLDRLKAEMGQVNVQQVAEKRGELRDRIKTVLQKDAAASLGLEVTDFQLTNLQYDERFRTAVSQAAVQKALIESTEYQRQQAEKQAETARITALGAANAQREQAKGQADANLAIATAEAKAIELKGLATANAIKQQADALKANADLVNLERVKKWDGALPKNIYAGAPLALMNLDKE